MKTFFKVLLILIAAVFVLKLLPVAFALGCLLAGGLAVLAGVGASLLAVLACTGVVLVALLAPLWLPVLAIIGLIALFRRADRTTA